MPQLPYDGDDYGEGQYPFDSSDYNSDLYASYDQAKEVYDVLDAYFHDTGFTSEQWFDMVNNISDVWYDDEGEIHFHFDWESYDGEYSGGHTF